MRSIPACAGEPIPERWCATAIGVYPRVCGGTGTAAHIGTSTYGLSPRVRGNHQRARADRPPRRSIPACAGEPVSHHPRGFLGKVYPRVCGGTTRAVLTGLARIGLSPRVRGNPSKRSTSTTRQGSIPACAGEPPLTGRSRVGKQVYPRVCGGTQMPVNPAACPPGLSPRVRGNPTIPS